MAKQQVKQVAWRQNSSNNNNLSAYFFGTARCEQHVVHRDGVSAFKSAFASAIPDPFILCSMNKWIISLICCWVALVAARASGQSLPNRLPDRVTFSVVIERGDIAQATRWLDAGLPPDFAGNLIGNGLMIGAWEGSIPMMALFLSRGANVNAQNAHGETALLHASWKGHLAAVQWLIAHGAAVNRQGKTWSALHYAAFAGHADIVDFLLKQHADSNAPSPNGSTPLMMAAREGKGNVATALLAAGAQGSITNDNGENAVQWAMRNNNVYIAREIVGSKQFAVLAERPIASWGKAQRSQAISVKVDTLLAQANKMAVAGQKEASLKLYREALSVLRNANEGQENSVQATAKKSLPAITGLVISAQRNNQANQTTGVQYATPAINSNIKASAESAPAANAADNSVEGWLQRARTLEAAGRRQEAIQAYRQAATFLRQVQ